MPSNTTEADNARKELLKRKFGRLFSWRAPNIIETVGPFDPSVFSKFEERRNSLLFECETILADMSDADIKAIFDNDSSGSQQKREDWLSLRREEITELNARLPPWLAGGFGHPDYKADFEYWGQMERLTLHEALILSVGVEPRHIGEQWLQKLIENKRKEELIPPLDYLVRRHELFVRRFSSNINSRNSASPSFLIDWFEEVDLAVHPEFADRLKHRRDSKPRGVENDSDTSTASQKNDKREIDSICQLFAALVIEYYGYDPKQARSPVPREVVELAASMGISITDDTVRKYLRRGAGFISDDWRPKGR